MLNYFRYLIVAILFGSLFYTYTITLSEEFITDKIEKKLPIVINKSGFEANLTNITIDSISDNVVEATIIGTLKMNDLNIVKKYIKKEETGFFKNMFKKAVKIEEYVDKSINLNILTKSTPQINGSKIYFKFYSIEITERIKFKKIKGILQNYLEKIQIPIKKLEGLSWLASTKSILFQDNGDLDIRVGISNLLILILIPLFLLREIGLFLILIYQKFLSPRKGYKCAKGHLHGNGTCSSTTKDAFKSGGFISGMKEYKKSTKECKQAYATIQEDRGRKVDKCDAASMVGCDGLSLVEAGEDSTSFCEAIDIVSCDVSSCDVSSCDVSSCDVGSCDVGSCDVGSC